MAKVKYYAKENSTIGTHSFYAVPIPNGKSRLGCTVAAKFSRQFSDEVSWMKVDPQAAAAASAEEDITEGGDNQGGGNGNNPPSGELEG